MLITTELFNPEAFEIERCPFVKTFQFILLKDDQHINMKIKGPSALPCVSDR